MDESSWGNQQKVRWSDPKACVRKRRALSSCWPSLCAQSRYGALLTGLENLPVWSATEYERDLDRGRQWARHSHTYFCSLRLRRHTLSCWPAPLPPREVRALRMSKANRVNSSANVFPARLDTTASSNGERRRVSWLQETPRPCSRRSTARAGANLRRHAENVSTASGDGLQGCSIHWPIKVSFRAKVECFLVEDRTMALSRSCVTPSRLYRVARVYQQSFTSEDNQWFRWTYLGACSLPDINSCTNVVWFDGIPVPGYARAWMYSTTRLQGACIYP